MDTGHGWIDKLVQPIVVGTYKYPAIRSALARGNKTQGEALMSDIKRLVERDQTVLSADTSVLLKLVADMRLHNKEQHRGRELVRQQTLEQVITLIGAIR